MNFKRGLHTVLTNLPAGQTPEGYYERGYAMFVADGMGGMPHADVASRTAILALIDLMLQTPDWIMRPDLPGTLEVLRRMEERFDRLPFAFKELAEEEPRLASMGTTMTLAVSLGADLIIAHVGASRAYLFRRGHLLRLTSDQTVAQTLANAGLIRPEDVPGHFARRMLTGSITAADEGAAVELHHFKLADGDQLLLCSDGLTEAVTEAAISDVLARELPAADAARSLVGQAQASGGEDDITAVLGRYHIPEE
ncbi:MAG TPA: protein phosphatase 2C domain-containing protein [Pyrinomonadaceae bacterium]|nr:protein phosphatase 2C domain-containing protein [Pyrinomonadaceae bacterium]